MQAHIKKVCRSASWGVCKIGKIRKLLDQPTTAKLVHAFISSHIDYCNSVFAGLPKTHLLPLQRILNTAARLVTLSRKSEKITPILRNLHWLPIHQRINFKVLLLVYKIINSQAPQYFHNLISLRSNTLQRPLRSSSTLKLTCGPRVCTRYGNRAFSVIAPQLWNSLPAHVQNAPTIETFKSLLKTHLFNVV